MAALPWEIYGMIELKAGRNDGAKVASAKIAKADDWVARFPQGRWDRVIVLSESCGVVGCQLEWRGEPGPEWVTVGCPGCHSPHTPTPTKPSSTGIR